MKNTLFLFCLLFVTASFSSEKVAIKVSVLKFGTVNWTLETIKQNKLDIDNGFELIIQPLASTQATRVALHAQAADIIAADWTWVARQRGVSSNYLFAPYSSSAGSLMVPQHSPITSFNDLATKKLGIAGGPLDKNWLLLRALAIKQGINLNQETEKVFGAPPLLNNLIQQGEVNALVNFWHYSARLKAKGFREVLNTHDIIGKLGISQTIPILGYVFSEQWGNENADILNRFLAASKKASNLLCTSDDHWAAILPLTRTNEHTTQQLLRSSYCKGRITHFSNEDKLAIAEVYAILASIGGDKLVGTVKQLDLNMFWQE